MGKTYKATEKLVYENALIQGNSPSFIVDKFGSGQEVDYSPNEVEKFGLFETSSPNYNNFYPDVKEEDLKPKEGDYIYPTYRALSEVIVRPRTPVDFSANNVLRDAMNLLVGQAVYPNHEMIAGDELGVVYGVNWSKAKGIKMSNGETIKIPAGINAILKIDGKSNPRIARSINMNPPAMHSVSVTVEFEWKKSHEMGDEEFYQKLGTYDEKGQLIRRIATKINKFYEISLVPHGADPFAKKVDENGNIVLPQFAKASYKFYDSLSEDSPYYTYEVPDEGTRVTTVSNSESTLQEINNTDVKQINTENMSKEQLLQLSQAIGCGEITEENFANALDSIKDLKGKAELSASLQSEKDALAKQVEDLKAEVQSKESELGKYSENLRAEVLKFANLALENNIPEATQNLIANADLETSKALLVQYQELCKDKFKQSVHQQDPDNSDEGGDEGKKQSLSNEGAVQELVEEYSKVNTKSIHC